MRAVKSAMAADSGIEMGDLRVNGGSVTNDVLRGHLANLVMAVVVRPAIDRLTAFGAAGIELAVVIFESTAVVHSIALERSKGWAQEGA